MKKRNGTGSFFAAEYFIPVNLERLLSNTKEKRDTISGTPSSILTRRD